MFHPTNSLVGQLKPGIFRRVAESHPSVVQQSIVQFLIFLSWNLRIQRVASHHSSVQCNDIQHVEFLLGLLLVDAVGG